VVKDTCPPFETLARLKVVPLFRSLASSVPAAQGEKMAGQLCRESEMF